MFAPWDELGYDREAVRRVLAILSRAFGWATDEGLRLRPEDRVWEIYWSYYPACSPRAPKWRRWIGSGPDTLEMETLDRDLRETAQPGKAVDLHLAVTVRDLVDRLIGSAKPGERDPSEPSPGPGPQQGLAKRLRDLSRRVKCPQTDAQNP